MAVRRLHTVQPTEFEFQPENIAWAKKVDREIP